MTKVVRTTLIALAIAGGLLAVIWAQAHIVDPAIRNVLSFGAEEAVADIRLELDDLEAEHRRAIATIQHAAKVAAQQTEASVRAASVTKPHPADSCHEDEAWVAVDHTTPGAIEDVHGVSRMCVNVSEVGR